MKIIISSPTLTEPEKLVMTHLFETLKYTFPQFEFKLEDD